LKDAGGVVERRLRCAAEGKLAAGGEGAGAPGKHGLGAAALAVAVELKGVAHHDEILFVAALELFEIHGTDRQAEGVAAGKADQVVVVGAVPQEFKAGALPALEV